MDKTKEVIKHILAAHDAAKNVETKLCEVLRFENTAGSAFADDVCGELMDALTILVCDAPADDVYNDKYDDFYALINSDITVEEKMDECFTIMRKMESEKSHYERNCP